MSLPQAGVQLVALGYDQYAQQFNSASQATAQFGQSATQSAPQIDAFGKMASGALKAVGAFAVTALAAAGAAVVGWVSGAKDAATKYERTMSDIVGLTGTSAAEVKQLSTEVLKLSGQVGKGPQELAEALYFVASSGFKGADAMTVLTASAKAAAAGLGDTKTIADLTTSILNAYQMKAGQAAHVTDILTQAVKDGKAEPDQLAGALGRVIPVAAAAGINLEEVAASVASMTRVGLDANESVTALRGIISALEKPSKQASDALASVGYSADDVRKSIKDRGLLVTLEEMYKRTNGNLDVLGKIVPNIRALTGVLATTATQGDAYAQTLQNMYNAAGATDKAFQQATKTMDFQGKALRSTLEALQIELGQALLPGAIAATEALVKFAQSLQGQVGPAVTEVLSVIGQVANAIRQGFIPVVAGATTALVAYAIVNAGTLLPALMEQIATLAISAGAWATQAAAVLAAAGPYIAIAAAIAAVGVAWNQWQEKNDAATASLLESRPWWNDATAAIESYGAAVGQAKDALTPYANTIQILRDQIQGEIKSLAERDEAGMVSDSQRQTEMDHINQLKGALVQATAGYNDQEQALLRTSAASMTGTARLQELRDGEQGAGEQAKLTEKELADLEKQIQKTFDSGATAVSKYVDTAVSFMAKWSADADSHTAKVAELTKARAEAKTESERDGIQKRIDAENTGYATSQKAAATAYATQEAAQRAHLGQMLADYTAEQVALGNITSTTADAILQQITKTFGQASTVSATTFVGITRDIDTAGRVGGSALSSLGTTMSQTMDKAVLLKQESDKLKGDYTMKILHNFDPSKQSLDDLRRALEDVPRRVDIEIVTRKRTIEEGSGTRTGGALGTRAVGGPVLAGAGAYLVGERGPELFIPEENGQIITADRTQEAIAGLAAAHAESIRMLRGAEQLDENRILELVQAGLATINAQGTVVLTQLGEQASARIADLANLSYDVYREQLAKEAAAYQQYLASRGADIEQSYHQIEDVATAHSETLRMLRGGEYLDEARQQELIKTGLATLDTQGRLTLTRMGQTATDQLKSLSSLSYAAYREQLLKESDAYKQYLTGMQDNTTATYGEIGKISTQTYEQMTKAMKQFGLQSAIEFGAIGDGMAQLDLTNSALQTSLMELSDNPYPITITSNIPEAAADAAAYADQLAAIPTEITTTVTFTEKERKAVTDFAGGGKAEALPGRASGGPVFGGQAYLVGEHGPEMFVSPADGQILANGGRTLDSMMIYAQQVMVQAPAAVVLTGSTVVFNQTTTTNMPLTVQTNQSPAVVQQSYYTARALAGV